jgi:tetratricopeptide (TPR) repeat protein
MQATSPVAAAAQSERPQPKAKTPEEAAAYQKFMAEQMPDEQIRLVEDFLLQYPDTELKQFAYQAAMQAYRVKNDMNHMLTYGELTLEQNPDNLTALIVLSSAIAEMTDRNDPEHDDKLDEGDQYAAHAIEVLGKLRRPPGFAEDRWNETIKDSTSAAYSSRGLISLIRADFEKAETELKQAVDLAAKPDAVLLYRLGMSYSFQKKYAPALEALERAAMLGGVKITAAGGKPRDLVAEAKDFAAKALAASGDSTAASAEVPAAAKSPAASSAPGQTSPVP